MKNYVKKANLLIAALATTLLSTYATAADKVVLVKPEPINKVMLINDVHNNLKLSLTPVTINYKAQLADSDLAKQKQVANKNKSVTVSNVN